MLCPCTPRATSPGLCAGRSRAVGRALSAYQSAA
jgi:hypothetical protein